MKVHRASPLRISHAILKHVGNLINLRPQSHEKKTQIFNINYFLHEKLKETAYIVFFYILINVDYIFLKLIKGKKKMN